MPTQTVSFVSRWVYSNDYDLMSAEVCRDLKGGHEAKLLGVGHAVARVWTRESSLNKTKWRTIS